jgi:hypothetical protein
MLCIVVVPRDVVMVQEREKLVSILLESTFAFYRWFALAIKLGQLTVKAINVAAMLPEIMATQSSTINCLHNWLQQTRKVSHNEFQLLIVRMLENIIVQVSHQVDEALLLVAVEGIVGSEKIANQNAFEIFQHLLQKRPIAAFSIQVGNVVQIGEDPDIRRMASDTHSRLVHMQQTPGDEMVKNALVGHLVVFGRRLFNVTKCILRQIEPEESAEILLDGDDRNIKGNCFVQKVGDQVASVLALWPEFMRFAEFPFAARTPIVMKATLHNPPLY